MNKVAMRTLAQSRLQELQGEFWDEPLDPPGPLTCFRSIDILLENAKALMNESAKTPGDISLAANAAATVALMTGSLPSISDVRVRKMMARILKDNPRFVGPLVGHDCLS